MNKKILVDATHSNETRVVKIIDGKIDSFDCENNSRSLLKGNIYLGRITRVEPSLQAVFVDYGQDKHGFLSFSEIHNDYLQIPESEKKLLEKSLSDRCGANYDSFSDWNSESEKKHHNDRSSLQGRIQDFIKKDQSVLVQVVKDQRGNKGVTLSTYISLLGRYCILLVNTEHQGGVSRRMFNATNKRNIRSALDNLDIPDGMSAIIREAGTKKNTTEVTRDYQHLMCLWKEIKEKVKTTTASNVDCALIYEGNGTIRRTILDLLDDDVSKMVISGRDAHKEAKEFVKTHIPNFAPRVTRYTGKLPIFAQHAIDDQILALYSNRVNLASGGYLVINRTEALIAIDINSGRMTREHNVEDTALKTNLEASEEISKQIRLRGLSGLIVIDFIGMKEYRHRYAVEDAFRNAVQSDKARIQLGRIDTFGLLAMSRQRMGPNFFETSTTTCKSCNGNGSTRTTESTANILFRKLENDVISSKSNKFDICVGQELATFLWNNMRNGILSLEKKHNASIDIIVDSKLGLEEFVITPHAKDNSRDNVVVTNTENIQVSGEKCNEREATVDDTEEIHNVDFYSLTQKWIKGLIGD